MTITEKIKKRTVGLFLLGSFLMGGLTSCLEGTTEVPNPKPAAVTFGQLTNGISQVKVPLEVFGDSSDDLTGATLQIFKNGSELDSNVSTAALTLDASSGFDSGENAVLLDVDSLTDQDVLSLIVRRLDNGKLVFSGTISASDDSIRSDIDCTNTTIAAEQLMCDVCERVAGCSTATTRERCLAIILSAACTDFTCSQVQLADEFGVPVEENSISMQGVAEGEESGIFTADPAFLGDCREAIQTLSCDVIFAGYDPSDPDNFGNFENFIPGNEGPPCGPVYGTPGGL